MSYQSTGAFVLVAILVAVVGGFLFGGLGLMAAIVIMGIAVLSASGDLEARLSPHPAEPPHPTRYACPGCGADAYFGQPFCQQCGAALPAAGKFQA